MIVLDETQPVLHLHVVGLEHADQHQRALVVERRLLGGVIVRRDDILEKQLLGSEQLEGCLDLSTANCAWNSFEALAWNTA
jgi:hypothetical protein